MISACGAKQLYTYLVSSSLSLNFIAVSDRMSVFSVPHKIIDSFV